MRIGINIQRRLAVLKQAFLLSAHVLERFVSSRIFLRLIFIWFIFQAIYMAVSTKYGIPPDEQYHYDFIKLFSENGWLPFIHDQSGFYSLGGVTHTPFFIYHYFLSFPFHIFGSSDYAVEILRLFNVALGAVSFYLANKLAIKLKVSPLVKNLSLFMLANTLMFVFLAGAINYDNLLVPLALLSFLLMFNLLDKFQASSMLTLVVVLFTGLLTAINFLPIACVIITILLVKFWHQFNEKKKQFYATWNKEKRLNLFLLLPLILLLLMFTQRYGLNMVNYRTYAPACDKINSVSQCMESGIYERSKNLETTRHSVQITPMEYFTSWSWSMNADTFGILAHKSISPNKIVKVWTELLLVVGALVVFRYHKNEKKWNILLVAFVLYASILFVKNYLSYKHNGVNLGVQGRYLFIFLPFIYFLVNHYLLRALKNEYLRATYIVLSVLVFITASLPTYLLKTSSDWYTSRSTHTNSMLHNKLLEVNILD